MKKILVIVLFIGFQAQAQLLSQEVTLTKLQVVTVGEGQRIILTDSKGMSLYTFKKDSLNESHCYDHCEKTWPPMIVNSEERLLVSAAFDVTVRRDGRHQLTLNGHPLYYFVGDAKVGDVTGEGLGDVWFLVEAVIK